MSEARSSSSPLPTEMLMLMWLLMLDPAAVSLLCVLSEVSRGEGCVCTLSVPASLGEVGCSDVTALAVVLAAGSDDEASGRGTEG